VLLGDVNGKMREMRVGSCGCCSDLGGCPVAALHKNYVRLGEFGETGPKFLGRGKFGIYGYVTC
jgi:hypothetical protein